MTKKDVIKRGDVLSFVIFMGILNPMLTFKKAFLQNSLSNKLEIWYVDETKTYILGDVSKHVDLYSLKKLKEMSEYEFINFMGR